MHLRSATLLVALALLASTGYVVVCAHQARAIVAEIRDAQITLISVRDHMSNYTTRIDCCGSPMDINKGSTITEHLAAVQEAKDECEKTCDR